MDFVNPQLPIHPHNLHHSLQTFQSTRFLETTNLRTFPTKIQFRFTIQFHLSHPLVRIPQARANPSDNNYRCWPPPIIIIIFHDNSPIFAHARVVRQRWARAHLSLITRRSLSPRRIQKEMARISARTRGRVIARPYVDGSIHVCTCMCICIYRERVCPYECSIHARPAAGSANCLIIAAREFQLWTRQRRSRWLFVRQRGRGRIVGTRGCAVSRWLLDDIDRKKETRCLAE